jgi:single-strand DNA-binding protein
MGNLTRDPQLKYLPNNTAVCEFGLAVEHRWRDREGNQREDVCFVELAAFGRPGETINQYMSKGRPILVEGRLKFDTWTSQDGTKRSKHSVVIDNFRFVDSREGGGEGGGGGGYNQGGAPQDARQQQPSQQTQPPASHDDPAPSYDDHVPGTDDIPF